VSLPRLAVLLTGAWSLLGSGPAWAQPPQNPFANLFGRAPERTAREYTKLDFTTQTGLQASETLEDDRGGLNDVPDGLSAGGDASMALNHIRDRFSARAHGRASYQEYLQEQPFGAPAYDGGASLTLRPTTRLTLDAGARYLRSPFFQGVQFAPMDPTALTLPSDMFAIQLLGNEYVEASAGLTSQFTRRSSIGIIGQWRQSRFLDDELGGSDFMARGIEGRWRRRITRDLGVHAGFGYDEIRPVRDDNLSFVNERIDIGVDYATALTVARRTTLSFSTETSMARENDGPRRFRVNGTIDLVKGFRRTWRASIGARRATDFLPGFAQPLLSDRAHASLGGFLAKRLMLHVNADGGRGRIGFTDKRDFLTYTGDARLTVALSRHIGLFTQYVYYHYQVPPDTPSIVQLQRLSRQGVSIGIQTWVPLIDKDKVDRDTR
jgi:hypothetical protein